MGCHPPCGGRDSCGVGKVPQIQRSRPSGTIITPILALQSINTSYQTIVLTHYVFPFFTHSTIPAPLLHLQPYYSPWYQTFKFIFRFKNLVDLASILPSYVSYFTAKNTNTNFLRTLRLLRLIRVLRLLKLLTVLKNVDVAIDLILATLTQVS